MTKVNNNEKEVLTEEEEREIRFNKAMKEADDICKKYTDENRAKKIYRSYMKELMIKQLVVVGIGCIATVALSVVLAGIKNEVE